jgi:hypothetical protein
LLKSSSLEHQNIFNAHGRPEVSLDVVTHRFVLFGRKNFVARDYQVSPTLVNSVERSGSFLLRDADADPELRV